MLDPGPRVALITGVTGQTGSYLVDLLLSRGYIVHGVTRGSPSDVPPRLDHVFRDETRRARFNLHRCDILDVQAFSEVLRSTKPNELYNFAAQSSVGVSFKQPLETARVDGVGVLSVLETVRMVDPEIRIFQASSSEMFGRAVEVPQTEDTMPYPCSPYANAKLMGHALARVYREAYGMYVCSGILYNHESSRRGNAFVTQKIVQAAVRIHLGLQESLKLGNLDSGRDWGHARDFVDCIWRMLQPDTPQDFIVATGASYTVREFAQLAFSAVGFDLTFHGQGMSEIGLDSVSGKTLVEVDPQFFRPTEPNQIIGNSTKAYKVLGWKPTFTVSAIVGEMVETYMDKIRS